MEELCTEIKTIFADFIQENLHLAAQQISETGRLKIKNGKFYQLQKHLVSCDLDRSVRKRNSLLATMDANKLRGKGLQISRFEKAFLTLIPPLGRSPPFILIIMLALKE